MNNKEFCEKELTTPEEFWAETDQLSTALLEGLAYFKDLGVIEVPASLAPPEPVKPKNVFGKASLKKTPVEPHAPYVKNEGALQNGLDLPGLERKIAECRLCDSSAKREKTVFGKGSNQPLMVFVVADPSLLENETGRLLLDIIEKGLKLEAEDHYRTSAIKCAGPDSEPGQKAAEACRPLLLKELSLLQPRIILAFGELPGRILSGRNSRLGLLRPRTHKLPELPEAYVRVTYGLEDIFESVEIKKEAWKDIQKIIPVIDKIKSDRQL